MPAQVLELDHLFQSKNNKGIPLLAVSVARIYSHLAAVVIPLLVATS